MTLLMEGIEIFWIQKQNKYWENSQIFWTILSLHAEFFVPNCSNICNIYQSENKSTHFGLDVSTHFGLDLSKHVGLGVLKHFGLIKSCKKNWQRSQRFWNISSLHIILKCFSTLKSNTTEIH